MCRFDLGGRAGTTAAGVGARDAKGEWAAGLPGALTEVGQERQVRRLSLHANLRGRAWDSELTCELT